MRDQFKGKMKSQFNEYYNKVKDEKVMENIMSMKDKIIKKTITFNASAFNYFHQKI